MDSFKTKHSLYTTLTRIDPGQKQTEKLQFMREKIANLIERTKNIPIYVSFQGAKISYEMADMIGLELETIGWNPTFEMDEPNEKGILFVDFLVLEKPNKK